MTTFITTTNGRISMRLRDTVMVARGLAGLDGDKRYAESVWPLPEELSFEDDNMRKAFEESEVFVQAAGSAERMTVEARLPMADGGYELVVLGVTPVVSPEESETIEWSDYTVDVHPEEVFTADQAFPIFEHFVATGTIPPGTPMRRRNLNES